MIVCDICKQESLNHSKLQLSSSNTGSFKIKYCPKCEQQATQMIKDWVEQNDPRDVFEQFSSLGSLR